MCSQSMNGISKPLNWGGGGRGGEGNLLIIPRVNANKIEDFHLLWLLKPYILQFFHNVFTLPLFSFIYFFYYFIFIVRQCFYVKHFEAALCVNGATSIKLPRLARMNCLLLVFCIC